MIVVSPDRTTAGAVCGWLAWAGGMRVSGVRLVEPGQAPLLARRYYQSGDPGPIVAALAHVPELLEVTVPFLDAALGPSAIDARTKELVILRTSALMGCRYCTQTHTVAARNSGLSVQEVAALRGQRPLASAFTEPRERALLRWVEAVADGRGPVPEAARLAVRAHLQDPDLVELTLLVGATLLLNRLCSALALPTSARVLRRLAREGWT
jgi:AhpD family alkylhydroperoxidase